MQSQMCVGSLKILGSDFSRIWLHSLYGHTLSNDEVKDSDQKVLRGSRTIRVEGIETRSEGLGKNAFGPLVPYSDALS